MSMLSARGVKVKTIDELTAAGLATVSIEHIGRGSIEVMRVKITEAGRRALFIELAPTSARSPGLLRAKATHQPCEEFD